jgi:hypothetical protein
MKSQFIMFQLIRSEALSSALFKLLGNYSEGCSLLTRIKIPIGNLKNANAQNNT